MQKNRKSLQKCTPKGSPPTKRAKTNIKIVQTAMEEECLKNDANFSDDEEGGTRIGDIYIPPPIPPHCSTESKGPRLIIKKITNFNFKSYAGKVVLGPFHHCFTAIIGPNGSGKSNVIDSMLFVFGYRANKIRCKKLSTLLHNSALYPNTRSCSVAVHFRLIRDLENGDCDEIPHSEIIVERVAYADNSSYYTINNRRVQFKEVSKLLKQHHVDLDHNRFLILQGEVESIAMMKPKGQNENECGMLEYLEDIVGTTRYKEPLIKINDRVEKLTEERTEKHNRCKLAERDMKDLEQPYNDAVNYLKQENENTRTKNLRIQKYLSEKKKKLDEYLVEYETVDNALKKHDDFADQLKNERVEKEELIHSELIEFDKLRIHKEELEKLLTKSNNAFTEVQENMTDTNKSRKKNKTQLEKEEEKLVELKKIPEKNQKEISECQKKIEDLKKLKMEKETELQKNYTEYNEQIAPLAEKREIYKSEMVGLETAVDEARAALSLAEKELKILKENETTETRKYESMKSSYEESQKNLNNKQEDAKKYSLKMPEIEKEVATKCRELGILQGEEKRMRESLLTLKNEVHEKKNLMQTARSSNKVLDSLMRQKNEGTIPGILGRLGDLGAIDSKYDVAISTACGRLDNIVVDTVNTAQACIEFLKQNDIGRASFVALEKVSYLANSSRPIQTPEEAPRLYDLVRVEDERVLPAFYFALRNTLVATELEQGTRIAYGSKRYRVVTLNGDLIEISGTMSGGGRTQIRGKMGTKVQTKTKNSSDNLFVTQKVLDDMEKTAEDLQSKINYNQEQQGRLEKDIQILKQTHKKLDGELHKLKVSIKSLEEQHPRIFKRLEAQKDCMQKNKTDVTKVQNLETKITQKANELKQSENAALSVSKKVDEIDTKIAEIRDERLKPVKSKINSIETQIKRLNANISKLNSEVTSASREHKKCIQAINQLKSNITKAEEDIRELSTRRTEFIEESAELNKKIEEAKNTIANTKSDSSELQKEIFKIQKLESECKLKRIEIEQKLQTISAKLNEVKGQIPYWQEQLQPLCLNEIPGENEPRTPLKEYTEDELASYTLQDIQYKESVQEEMLKKKPNLSCISEYIEKRDIYLERVKVLEDITSKRNEMRQLYDDVRNKRYKEFMQGFHVITRKLKEMYQMITQGGDAELELVDSMDPFTEGVLFSVRPPRKSWKNISNLSGGEKTLSSLALVFALHYYNPSPLYFMDEIDAALDFKNISIVAHYIKERTKNAQFIIISLRSNMFELSDYLVGIYKVYDCTASLTFKNSPPILSILQSKKSNIENDISNSSKNEAELQNDENSAPIQDRDTIFAPSIESTAISQAFQCDLTNITNSFSYADDVFKKPLPRSQQGN